jgi:predicted metal-binding protein
MLKHTLFVCQSCHHSSEEHPKDQPTDGDCLLEQLKILHTKQPQSADFEIQPTGCLWTCEKPCADAFSAPHKPSSLFINFVNGLWKAWAITFIRQHLLALVHTKSDQSKIQLAALKPLRGCLRSSKCPL